MSKKTYQKFKMNQLENNVFRKFCAESLLGVIFDEEITDERFFGIDLPVIALISDVCISLDYVKVDYVKLKNISCNPNKILQYFEYKLSLKPYKNLVYKNNSLMDYIRAFFDAFMKNAYQKTVDVFIEVLRDAEESAKGEHAGITKPPSVN